MYRLIIMPSNRSLQSSEFEGTIKNGAEISNTAVSVQRLTKLFVGICATMKGSQRKRPHLRGIYVWSMAAKMSSIGTANFRSSEHHIKRKIRRPIEAGFQCVAGKIWKRLVLPKTIGYVASTLVLKQYWSGQYSISAFVQDLKALFLQWVKERAPQTGGSLLGTFKTCEPSA